MNFSNRSSAAALQRGSLAASIPPRVQNSSIGGAAVDASPDRLRQIEDRLVTLERLKRKHGPTLQDVIDRGESLARERALLTDATGVADDIQRQLDGATSAYLEVARDLSRRRRAAAPRFAREIEVILAELAMERTRFEVRFAGQQLPPEQWSERGVDQAEFFVSPNPGEDLRPLARIVSGGELSRVMLALKTLNVSPPEHSAGADARAGKTLIFD